MSQAVAISEFPFVTELPKREARKVKTVWDVIQDMRALQESKGHLLPASVAKAALGVCKQRVHQLMDSGRLERVDYEGHVFVTLASVEAFARSERKAGRPVKMDPDTKDGCYQLAGAITAQALGNLKPPGRGKKAEK